MTLGIHAGKSIKSYFCTISFYDTLLGNKNFEKFFTEWDGNYYKKMIDPDDKFRF